MRPSIQYQVSNIILPKDVLYNFTQFFQEVLITGRLPLYLAYQWKRVKELGTHEGIDFEDADRDITPDDIKYQMFFFNLKEGTKDTMSVGIVEFPDYHLPDATGKYGLIVTIPGKPSMYFTLEYGESIITHEPVFFVGKWMAMNGHATPAHFNYGTAKDKEEFLRVVFDALQKESPEYDIKGKLEDVLHPENMIEIKPENRQ